MNFGKFSVRNPVLINILMIAILAIGLMSFLKIPRELMSRISFHQVFVVVPYPGATASDVEKNIIIPLEKEIEDVKNIKKVSATARQGVGFLNVEFENMDDDEFRSLFQDLRTEIDKVEFPEDALDPEVNEFTTDDFMSVIQVVLRGDGDQAALYLKAEELKEKLLDFDEVSRVEIIGSREREVRIEAKIAELEAKGVALDEIVQAVQMHYADVPGGRLKTGSRSWLVRTLANIDKPEEFADLVIRRTPGQDEIRIRDVADVADGWAESEYDARFNGEKSILLNIAKKGEASSFGVVDKVKGLVEKEAKSLEPWMKITTFNDTSYYIRDIMDILGTNAKFGLILVFVVLMAFLGLRYALIASLAIPLTFAITFIFMEWYGESLNGNSLFGLVLVLGMIVDHAIVIVENAYRHRQAGMDSHNAAIKGTNEVAKAIIAGTLTTVAAFLPAMLISGVMGKFMRIIPIVVCLALVASTVEALLFLPSHAADWGKDPKERVKFALFKKLKEMLLGWKENRPKLYKFFLIGAIATPVNFIVQSMMSSSDPSQMPPPMVLSVMAIIGKIIGVSIVIILIGLILNFIKKKITAQDVGSGLVVTMMFGPLFAVHGISRATANSSSLGKILLGVLLFAPLSIIGALFILGSFIKFTFQMASDIVEPITNSVSKFFDWLKGRFIKILRLLYRYHWATGIASIFIMIAVLAGAKHVKKDMFAGEEMTVFAVNIKMPMGTDRSETDRVVRKMEECIRKNADSTEVVAIASTSGFANTGDDWVTSSRWGQINVDLEELRNGRTRPIPEIMNDFKEKCEDIPGAENIRFMMFENGPPMDKPITFRVQGENMEEMNIVAEHFVQFLQKYDVLYNISSNYEAGSPEMRIVVNEEAAAELGLSAAQVGIQIRGYIEGVDAGSWFDEDEEMDIVVKLREEDRNSQSDLLNMHFTTPDGRKIRFGTVAELKPMDAAGTIKRVDKKREIMVSADSYDKTQSEVIMKAVQKEWDEKIAPTYPSLTRKDGGEFEEFGKFIGELLRLFLVGFGLMYLVLGAQFKSYIQPLLMSSTILFAGAGVVAFMLITGTPLSFVVMLSILALAGIAVNDSIVLISYINSLRRRGVSTTRAVIQGASTRLRPVILTSVTTVGGLIPMAIGIGGKSATWAPMASTITFGLIFSTVGTLVIVPCLYGMLDGISRFFGFKMKLEGDK